MPNTTSVASIRQMNRGTSKQHLAEELNQIKTELQLLTLRLAAARGKHQLHNHWQLVVQREQRNSCQLSPVAEDNIFTKRINIGYQLSFQNHWSGWKKMIHLLLLQQDCGAGSPYVALLNPL
jgi:hypothetical protein